VLSGDVDLVEQLGSELVVHLTIDANRMLAEGAVDRDEAAAIKHGEVVARVVAKTPRSAEKNSSGLMAAARRLITLVRASAPGRATREMPMYITHGATSVYVVRVRWLAAWLRPIRPHADRRARPIWC
jgi:hypothetical protein